MALLKVKENASREYWEGLKTKEQLYAAFDRIPEYERTTFSNEKPDLPEYYPDSKFKEAGEKLKAAAAPLIPILQDIAKHYPVKGYPNHIYLPAGSCEGQAKELIKELDPTDPGGVALIAWVILTALEGENNICDRIATGSGIPEARAAFKAYKRYCAFKETDAERMKAFKETQEYRNQCMEMRLGLRKEIVLPEPGANIKGAFYKADTEKYT